MVEKTASGETGSSFAEWICLGNGGNGKKRDRRDRRNVTLCITFHLSRSHIPAWGDGCLKVCLYNCKANEKAS